MKPLITKAPKKTTSTTKPVTPPPPAASSTSTKPAAVKPTAAKPKLISRPKPKTIKPAPKPIPMPLLGPPVVVTAPAPTVASTNGPLNQIPPESPTPPPAELVEPVPVTKLLIITIPPESPAPPAEAVILTSSGDKKASGYAVVESEVIQPSSDTKVPAGYIVVESDSTPPAPSPAESDATGLPLVAPAPAATEDTVKPTSYLVVESEVTDTKKPGYTVVESDSTPEPSAEPSMAVPSPASAMPTVMIPASQAMEEISSIQIGDVLIIAVKVQSKQEPEAIG